MPQRIAHIALVVNNYDDAIEFYTTQLDFQWIEDTPLGAGSAARCEGMLLALGKSEARCPTPSER